MASKLGVTALYVTPTQESGGSFEFDPRTPQDRRHWLTAQSINQSVMPIMCRTVSNTIFCQIQHTHYKYLSTKLRQLITLTLKNEHEILTLSVPSQNISYPHKHHCITMRNRSTLKLCAHSQCTTRVRSVNDRFDGQCVRLIHHATGG